MPFLFGMAKAKHLHQTLLQEFVKTLVWTSQQTDHCHTTSQIESEASFVLGYDVGAYGYNSGWRE